MGYGEIDDADKLQSIINDLYQVSSEPLSQLELNEIVKTIDDYAKDNPPVKEYKPKLEIPKHRYGGEMIGY